MPSPTPKFTYTYSASHFVRVHDVDWAGGVLELPLSVESPRTAKGYECMPFLATTDVSTEAAFKANLGLRLGHVYRSADGLVWTRGTPTAATQSVGRYQLIEFLAGSTVDVAADYQVLPTGMTWASGAAPAPVTGLTEETIAKLRKTGFSPRSAKTLGTAVSSPTTVDWKAALRRGDMSYRQMNTLRNPPVGGHTMKSLLRGGFTRHQAKLILGG